MESVFEDVYAGFFYGFAPGRTMTFNPNGEYDFFENTG